MLQVANRVYQKKKKKVTNWREASSFLAYPLLNLCTPFESCSKLQVLEHHLWMNKKFILPGVIPMGFFYLLVH